MERQAPSGWRITTTTAVESQKRDGAKEWMRTLRSDIKTGYFMIWVSMQWEGNISYTKYMEKNIDYNYILCYPVIGFILCMTDHASHILFR